MALLLLAVGLSMDAFAASVSQSAADRSGSLARTALVLGLAFGLAHGLMPLLGWSLGVAFAPVIRSVDHWVAFVLLGGIGGRMLAQGWPAGDRAARTTAARGWALLALALATSVDAAVAGAAFVGLGQPVALACAAIGVTTFLVAGLGVFVGGAAGVAIGPRAQAFGGLMLMALALKILIEHLYFGA